MSREFNIEKDPFVKGEFIYKKSKIKINQGVTVLVGCNGCGKTTLLNTIKNELKDKDIAAIAFNNLLDGGDKSISEAIFHNNIDFAGIAMSSSEGENIIMNLGKFANKIGKWVKQHKGEKELWVLLDACDSGLSIDNIVDVKEHLFKIIIEDNPNSEVYIVVAANEYELANGEQCFDVQNGEYIVFKNYEEYRKMILKSKENKDKRYE